MSIWVARELKSRTFQNKDMDTRSTELLVRVIEVFTEYTITSIENL